MKKLWILVFMFFLVPTASASSPLMNDLGGKIGFGEHVLPTLDNYAQEVNLTRYFEDGIKIGDEHYFHLFITDNGTVQFQKDAEFSSDLKTFSMFQVLPVDVVMNDQYTDGSNRIYLDLEENRVVVTWYKVKDSSSDNVNTFQFILEQDKDVLDIYYVY